MSFDLTNEHPITLKEVPKHVPKRGGKKVHYSTVYRWATRGARGRVLESAMVGGIRYTTVEAIGRFLNHRRVIRDPKDAPDDVIEDALRRAGL
ncbi:DUF1580 domain-containing protein [Crateriforma conspicua]|uniref:DUF1580 domain-containing protein n=1 Tax=Crateriforma conspicua TaxID=2527996 RepID=UPI0011B7F6EE|nr:DUF1580 domain-containing protein [Crateriforma conspicua]